MLPDPCWNRTSPMMLVTSSLYTEAYVTGSNPADDWHPMTQISSLQCHQMWLTGKSTIKWRFICVYIYYYILYVCIYVYILYYLYIYIYGGFSRNPFEKPLNRGSTGTACGCLGENTKCEGYRQLCPCRCRRNRQTSHVSRIQINRHSPYLFFHMFQYTPRNPGFLLDLFMCCPLLGSIEY